MAKIDKIKQALKELSPEDKLHLWNLRCSEGGYADDQIYENDEEFFNMFFNIIYKLIFVNIIKQNIYF